VHEFDELVVVENLLVEQPGLNSEVDGPDFRSGEFNIFLFTNQPQEAFRAARKTIQSNRPPREFKAAYRELGQDRFVIVWPPTLKEFKIS